jgi:hypothetical protein
MTLKLPRLAGLFLLSRVLFVVCQLTHAFSSHS